LKLEKEIVSEGKVKPVRDEQTLAKLLEAAYVLQEHNREMLEMELRLDLRPEQLEQTQLENLSEKDPLEKYPLWDEKKSPASMGAGTPPTQEGQATAKTNYSSTLAEIVSTQHQIQVRHLELDDAMSLVTERLTQIARASGAMVGILNGKKVQYRAASGLALPAGTEVPMEKALCFSCLESGKVLRCGDVHHEDQLDLEECRWRGIQSLIAVPIFHDGEVAGGLELYYPNPRAFTDHDVHTCQLMAGLVTEALAHDKEVNLKKSLASERAVMLQALEKLHPNLAALVDISGARDAAPKATVPPAAKLPTSPAVICRKCGHKLVGEEQFCGNCGTPRSSDYEPPSMQSKVASLWHMQEAMKKSAPAPAAKDEPAHEESIAHPDAVSPDPVSFDAVRFEKPLADALEKHVPDLLAAADLLHEHENTHEKKADEPQVDPEFDDSAFSDLELSLVPAPVALVPAAEVKDLEPTAIAPPARPTTWSSAATARAFLEQLAAAHRPGGLTQLWNTHRGDIYLAIALILVICVMGWGLRSTHSVGATGNAAAAVNHHKPGSAASSSVPVPAPAPTPPAPAPDASLSLFDRMLIRMGLAEPPAAPEYKGNPATQVWVDLHTALYYCPGADLYGKTAKGKFASQRDAQLDQFEPAYRKACD
jgi:putative methionine-R-sulfoxide reductase with GAF domain